MEVLVECICGRKFQVDSEQVKEFECESCGRPMVVPPPPMAQKLAAIRARMGTGEPGMREAMRDAAALGTPHALPLLRGGAESGVREAVNTALCAMCDLVGPGTDLVAIWIQEGRLSMSRLASAFRELKYTSGTEFLCGLIDDGKLKENQVAEVADYLGETGSQRALDTLKAARKAYPNMSSILDQALTRLRHLDASAGGVPDEAKRIPGQSASAEEAPAKKGCMGVLLMLAVIIAAVAAAVLS